MNELALFAGAGGGILGGVLEGWTTVGAVEKEPYCREVLLRRQRDGLLPLFPIWDDIRTFDGRPWCGVVDVVTAGFPCQPFSVAGKQRGEHDDRNLWPDTLRVIREVGPRFALLENVPGLLSNDYFTEIVGGLAEAGFDASWGLVSASDLGAPHRRRRAWIVAHAIGTDVQREHRRSGGEGWEVSPEPRDDGAKGPLEGLGWRSWSTEPGVGRVAHGLAHRMDRLRALGNGQVPVVARAAWRILLKDMSE